MQNVAYDLARFDRRSRVREAVVETPISQKAVRVRAVPKIRISPAAFLLSASAMLLLFLIVFSCMRSSMLSLEVSNLAQELSELKAEERRIARQYSGYIDLSSVEEYALNELNMVVPGKDSIIFVDLSGEDYGVVYEKESIADIFWKTLGGIGEGISK